MRHILTEAAKVGSAMALATSYRTRLPLQRYDDRQWIEIGNTGYPYYEQDGHTMLSGLSLVGWFATGSSIAMVTPPPGKGSAYMWTYHDGPGHWLDGAREYELTLPPGVPMANFWSVVVYDVWTRHPHDLWQGMVHDLSPLRADRGLLRPQLETIRHHACLNKRSAAER